MIVLFPNYVSIHAIRNLILGTLCKLVGHEEQQTGRMRITLRDKSIVIAHPAEMKELLTKTRLWKYVNPMSEKESEYICKRCGLKDWS